jgi:leucyl/phenylalanyl-tRNA---protein transferase
MLFNDGPLLSMPLFQLDQDQFAFPPAQLALEDPNGLLAIGGDLRPERLLEAYRNGIFPWFDETQPLLWWSPDPRSVLYPNQIHLSRSLQKFMARNPYAISCDKDFAAVIDGCASPRKTQQGTWITSDMRCAYLRLHELGHAHSIEIREGSTLVGGLYGIAIGRAFFGESMFSNRINASKVALVTLAETLLRHGFHFIDCQVHNPHLESMGAVTIPRTRFLSELNEATIRDMPFPVAAAFFRRASGWAAGSSEHSQP